MSMVRFLDISIKAKKTASLLIWIQELLRYLSQVNLYLISNIQTWIDHFSGRSLQKKYYWWCYWAIGVSGSSVEMTKPEGSWAQAI
jgi:hypothetical protein